MTIEPKFLNRSTKFASGDSTANLTESIKESESIGIDNARDATLTSPELGFFNVPANASDPTPTGVVWDWQNERRKPQYSVLLADLFPFLKLNQLPLYLMSEQVSIHLTFVTKKADGSAATSQRLCHNSAQVPQKDITLTRPDCQMVSDYIFYPQDMMEQYRQANSDMTFTYVDYHFVKRTISAAQYANGLIQNLGGAGRIVNKVFVGSAGNSAEVGRDQSLLNVYQANGPDISGTTTNKVTTNIKYNDNFLYPIDVSNDARHYHNVFMTEGRVPYIARDLYRGEGELATNHINTPGSCDFEDHNALDTLQETQFWTAYRLNRGERVNSRGIELYDTRSGVVGSSTMRAWLQVMRVASLKDGMFEMSYA